MFLILVLLSFSCRQKKQEPEKNIPSNYKRTLEKVNKVLVDNDTEIIKNYINRRNWEMSVSATGLWYNVYFEGGGKKVNKRDYVELNYKLWLLDGTLLYSSDSTGPKKFIVGKGGVEAGLEEGVLFLTEKSKARFILPPHLAHGLIGDGDKIPGRAIILYDIEVVKIGQ